jgi:hypothetical protein
MTHEIVIVPNEELTLCNFYRDWVKKSKHHTIDEKNPFINCVINKVNYSQEIVIAPCAIEHYSCYDLFKLKLFCKENAIKIIAFGSLNQFPYLSLVADELVMVKNSLDFYKGKFTVCGAGVESIQNDPNFCSTLSRHPKCKDIYRQSLLDISNDEVVENFWEFKVYIRESSYDSYKYLTNSGFLNENMISCQISCDCGPGPVGKKLSKIIENANFNYKLFNLDYGPCQKHLDLVGHDFMSHQILLSWLSNWYYICCGGSGSLMSIIPVKLLHVYDRNFNNVVSISEDQRKDHELVGIDNRYISEQIGLKRFGEQIGKFMPNLKEEFDVDQVNFNILHMPKILPTISLFNHEK